VDKAGQWSRVPERGPVMDAAACPCTVKNNAIMMDKDGKCVGCGRQVKAVTAGLAGYMYRDPVQKDEVRSLIIRLAVAEPDDPDTKVVEAVDSLLGAYAELYGWHRGSGWPKWLLAAVAEVEAENDKAVRKHFQKRAQNIPAALRAAAAVLMGEHFKTTDDMLKWASEQRKKHPKGDVPAPEVSTKQTTTDSELPETFGRVFEMEADEDNPADVRALDRPPNLDEVDEDDYNFAGGEQCNHYDDARDVCLDKVAAKRGK
jgi:hypothetical protein